MPDTTAAAALMVDGALCEVLPQALVSKGATGKAAKVAKAQTAALPLLWQGDVDAAVRLVASAGALNADFVALAAGAGVHAWKAVVSVYAKMLEAVGEVHLAVAYHCAAADFKEAVEAYRRQGLLEEAVLLAERHLPGDPELTALRQQLLLKLQRAASISGSASTAVWAASVAMKLGQHSDAVASLAAVPGGRDAQLQAAQLALGTQVPELVQLGGIVSARQALSDLLKTDTAALNVLWRHDRVVCAAMRGAGVVGVLLETLIMCFVVLRAQKPADSAPDLALAIHAAAAAAAVGHKVLQRLPAALQCTSERTDMDVHASNALEGLVMSFVMQLLNVLAIDASVASALLTEATKGIYADFLTHVVAVPTPDLTHSPDVVARLASLILQAADATTAKALAGPADFASENHGSCKLLAPTNGSEGIQRHSDRAQACTGAYAGQHEQLALGTDALRDECIYSCKPEDQRAAAAEVQDVVGQLCGVQQDGANIAQGPGMHAASACALAVLQFALSKTRAYTGQDAACDSVAGKAPLTAWVQWLRSFPPATASDEMEGRDRLRFLGPSGWSLLMKATEGNSRECGLLPDEPAINWAHELPCSSSYDVQPAPDSATGADESVGAHSADERGPSEGGALCASSQLQCDLISEQRSHRQGAIHDIQETQAVEGAMDKSVAEQKLRQQGETLDMPETKVGKGALDELSALLLSAESSYAKCPPVQRAVSGHGVAAALQEEPYDDAAASEASLHSIPEEREPDSRVEVRVTPAVSDEPLYPGLPSRYVQSFQKTEQAYGPRDWPRLRKQLQQDTADLVLAALGGVELEDDAGLVRGTDVHDVLDGTVVRDLGGSGSEGIVARMWEASIAAHPFVSERSC
jgi:hypothetical protein